ncbi:unnamed protein product [Rhizopus stolonifer]
MLLLAYLLFYVVMFMRLVILELDRYSRWIKCVGILLIGLRFADWPYELAFVSIQNDIMSQAPGKDATCWAIWGSGVIILNFVGDALANLFLSGMFIRRLFIHINSTKALHSQSSKLIGNIAKKSLICLTLTFVVNLIMNLLKVTTFLGTESDAFTVYFELIESTLLVEALRNDSSMRAGPNTSICESCHKTLSHSAGHKRPNQSDEHHSQMLVKSFGERKKSECKNTSDIEDNISYDNRSMGCNDRTVENIAPVEPALFNSSPRHPPPPFPPSFSTSLTPRPLISTKKDGLFPSLGSPTSTASTQVASHESFAMDSVRNDREGSDPMMPLSSNSNYSQSSHYWKGGN